MVEKIIINPTKVRAYGNIVNVKSDEDYEPVDCIITEDTDTVYGATVNVIVMEPDFGEATTLTVTSSSSTLVLGNTVNISATLKDSSNAAISGATITFKEGTTTLGNSTTNSSGVATYTYTGASVGDHTINAGFAGDSTYAGSTGNVSVTVNNHSYSLAFSQSSYVASGGSATLECTLLDNNVPVEGATISVSGSDSSLYTGLTNNDGVAQVTVTGLSATATFTASYSNVSDTCTVNVQSYIVDISGMTDQSNEFGSILNFRSNGSSGSGSMSYDSTNHYYVFASTNTGQERFIPITALTGLNDFQLTFEAQVVTTHLFGFGEFVGSTNTNCSVYIGTDDGHFKKHQGSDTNISTGASSGTWYSFKVTVDSAGYYVTIKDLNDNVKVDNYRCTISNSNTTQYGFTWGWQGTSQRFYLRNIKAEPL